MATRSSRKRLAHAGLQIRSKSVVRFYARFASSGLRPVEYRVRLENQRIKRHDTRRDAQGYNVHCLLRYHLHFVFTLLLSL